MKLAAASAAFLFVDQLLLWTVLSDDRFLQRAVAPFDPPIFTPGQEQALARVRATLSVAEPSLEALRFDAELGWCVPANGGSGEFRYDWAGCRIGLRPLARDKPPGTRRIVAIGCSMTHADEVGASDAWCSQLDEALEDAEVANLGMGAYGIDQALLRLQRDGRALAPDEVWLGFLPTAALRVTTSYHPLAHRWARDVAFKPRFVLNEQGELTAIANPARSLADIPALLADQEAFLEAVSPDPWVDRVPAAYAPRGSSWLHRSFTTRLALTLWESRGRDAAQALEDAKGETYALLRALVLETRREARSMGARFRLLILPGPQDLSMKSQARSSWEVWAHELEAAGIEVFDLSDALLSAGPSPAEFFAPGGHYTASASRVVAEALVRYVREGSRER